MRRSSLLLVLVGATVVALVLAAAFFAGDDGPEFSRGGTTDRGGAELPADLAGVTRDWTTDFSSATIELDELLIGINAVPIRDRIRPIDSPVFDDVASARADTADREPGLSLEVNGDARFYPLRIMTAHEIVNDVVGGVPLAVTYCPLCNSAIAFDRRIDGEEARFGVSGLLRNSDLVMWDDLTESLWQQIGGEGIVGELAGRRLEVVPAGIVAFSQFVTDHPDGQVLSQDQVFGLSYGFNPYEQYSSRAAPFGHFFDEAQLDDRFPALERVVGVGVDESATSYPFSSLESTRVVNDVVADAPVAVFWGGTTADALDHAVVAQGDPIGTALAFDRRVDIRTLTFEAGPDDTFIDTETGSVWNLLGEATGGALAGTRLEPVVHTNEFWFAWSAFNPEGTVWQP